LLRAKCSLRCRVISHPVTVIDKVIIKLLLDDIKDKILVTKSKVMFIKKNLLCVLNPLLMRTPV